MRIVAGHFRGRRLKGPVADGVRPTSDRLRETLFNVLGPLLGGARVLDAFAGTGALGLEAVSRGAARAVFVEQDRRAVDVIRANVAACGAENACAIIRDDFLSPRGRRRTAVPEADRFDLILLDPPYDLPDLAAALAVAAGHLAADGRIVLEHRRRREVPDTVAGLRRVRLLEAGDSALSFYQEDPA